MLPIKLIIEGIYSYKNRQEIDFERLTEAGLFGIFGNVGSGKSSILEAITYALYGATDRLHQGDKRGYNMMNLNSDKAFVSFEFSTSHANRYKFEVSWRRNSKRHEDVTSPLRTAYKWENDNWLPLESVDASDILGLKYDNFKRTIIIPQGKFKEFLELTGKDRIDMMKEIFVDLKKYDLVDKARKLLEETDRQLQQLSGSLIVYEQINPETIDANRAILNGVVDEYQSLNKQVAVNKEKLILLTTLKQNYEALYSVESQLHSAFEMKSGFDLRAKNINDYELAYKQFAVLFNQKKIAESERNNLESTLQTKQVLLKNAIQDFEEWNEKLATILPQFEKIEQAKIALSDLHTLVAIRKNEQSLQENKPRIENGEIHIGIQEKEIAAQELLIQNHEEKIATLKSQKIDSALILSLSQWFEKRQVLMQNQVQVEQELTACKNEISKIDTQIGKRNETFFEQAYQDIQARKKELEQAQHHWKVQEQIGVFVHELKDGKPCLLCGSTEHPKVLTVENAEEHLAQIQAQLANISTQTNQIQEQKEVFIQALARLQQYRAQEKVLHDKSAQIIALQTQHQTTFNWNEFEREDPEQIQYLQQKNTQIDKQIEQHELEINKAKTLLGLAHQNSEKYKQAVSAFKSDQDKWQGALETLISKLQHYKVSDFKNETIDDIQKKAAEEEKRIEKTKTQHQLITTQLEQFKEVKNNAGNEVDFLKQRRNAILENISNLENEIKETLSQSAFDKIETVQSILENNLDVAVERKAIEDFNKQYDVLQHEQIRLKTLMGNQQFDEEIFDSESKNLELQKTHLEALKNQKILLEQEIKDQELNLKKKKELQEKHDQLTCRWEDLKKLKSMFDGNGFVNYVSGVYLQNLCNVANTRFHRLTKNQFSLVLKEKNEFEVMDYLNGGRTRSVKTLSGGQSFQASLCLALALAESVQTLNQFDKNFFFIDEGFGTQDKASIETVFQTLEELHKENRIVGIISHVEELQERIPRYLLIENDTDKGSLIHQH